MRWYVWILIMLNVTTVSLPLAIETITWKNRVIAAGGSFEWDSVAIANAFIRSLNSKTYYSKIIYLLPMIGKDIGACLVPLVDKLNIGTATNEGSFVNTDFSQFTGLQTNGVKTLDLGMKTSVLGSGGNGGFGYWETNYDNSMPDGWVMGVYPSGGDNSEIYGIDGKDTNCIGWYGNSRVTYSPPGNAHWYMNRSSSTNRTIYKNGVSVFVDTTFHTVNNIAQTGTIRIGGIKNGSTFYRSKTRCAVAYLTNGTMTDSEAYDLNLILKAYLLGPSGKSF